MSKQSTTNTPKQRKLRVYVVGGGQDIYHMFFRNGHLRATDIENADLVVFTGGSDVSPARYNEMPLPTTQYDVARDKEDIAAWRLSQRLRREGHDRMYVGICRGGQFLNVMNGGKLWQDVNNHGHSHMLTDEYYGTEFKVSSTHHQMFRPGPGAMIVATAREATRKLADKLQWFLKDDGKHQSAPFHEHFKKDMEVIYYPETKCLCFQPHPEYSEPRQTELYFFGVLERILDYQQTGVNHLSREAKKETA